MKDYFADLVPATSDSSTPSLSGHDSGGNTPAPYPPTMPIPMSPETLVIEGALEIVKQSIQCFTQYSMCLEHEKTERARIAAQLEAVTRQIKAKKDSIMEILEQNAQDRDRLYTQAEESIQVALKLHDVDMLAKSYNFMLEVYMNSPSLESLRGQFEK